jgi:hypothetical protein
VTRHVAALGALVYVATLVVVPLANPALDVLRLHPEDFAQGSFGFLVSVGYAALAVALVAISLIAMRLRGTFGSLAVLAFGLAALTCVANAVDPTLGTRRSPIELGVFGLVVGPLALSAALRLRTLIALAALVACAFVALLASPEALSGMVNRVFDALAGLWCIVLASSYPAAAGRIMRPSGEVA